MSILLIFTVHPDNSFHIYVDLMLRFTQVFPWGNQRWNLFLALLLFRGFHVFDLQHPKS